MFFTALTTWFRGLLALALVIGGIALLKKWVDDLPREKVVLVTPSGPAEARSRPLASLPERIDAWRYDPNRSTAPLIWGGLLLLLAVGGRLVSP